MEKVELSRDLGVFSVTMIGVGGMIGAGIFVLTGIAAGIAGPALILAFALNGVVTLLTAMVYAELGSAIPEAGGGYLWVKKGLPSVNGFLSGWMSWFAHTVAGSLYSLGFAAYAALILEYFGISFFGFEGVLLHKTLAVAIILIFALINFKGVSEIGKAANIVAIVKIIILAIFVFSGLLVMLKNPHPFRHFTPFLPKGFDGVLKAMGLTFIAFEGYEIIVQAGEEIENPKKNIPKAVFYSIAIVVPIYLLVAISALGAIEVSGMTTWEFLGFHKELGLLEAARQFMPYGTILLLFGGIVSTMSALNATTFSSTRVSFAMGRDFNLPHIFGKIHRQNRTPFIALFISALLMIFMAVALPIEDVASASDIMFLLLFLQVNIAVINIRKRMGRKLEYGYKMPLFPIVPILGVISKLFLALYLFTYSPKGWVATLFWIGIGVIIFFSYSQRKEKVEKEKTIPTLFEKEGRMLVCLSDPSTTKTMMNIASSVVKEQDNEIIVLHVIEIPYQTFLQSGREFVKRKEPMIEDALKIGKKLGVKVTEKIKISHNTAHAILEASERRDCKLILLGWTGKFYAGKIKRSVPHQIMAKSHADVWIIKDRGLGKKEKILVPVGEGFHIRRLKAADKIAKAWGAEIILLSVVSSFTPPNKKVAVSDRLTRDKLLISGNAKIEVADGDIAEVIVKKSKECDLILIGPSHEWVLSDVLFGSIPDKIANEANCSVLMIKEFESRIESIIKHRLKSLVNYFLSFGSI